MPRLCPEALVDPNDFRRNRLYFEECDDVLKRHRDMLMAMYNAHRTRDLRSGQRSKAGGVLRVGTPPALKHVLLLLPHVSA
jgi:hypothetical protein